MTAASFQVLTEQAESCWTEALARFGDKYDFYHTFLCHIMYAKYENALPRAFIYQSGEYIYFHPFLLCELPQWLNTKNGETLYDMQSVYGYSGPLSNTDDINFINEAREELNTYCAKNKIIAEFIRFNPIIGNHRYVCEPTIVFNAGKTIVVDCNVTEEELWVNSSSIHRNTVRKAQKNRLVGKNVPIEEYFEEYLELYLETMKSLNAEKWYFFNKGYYEFLSKLGSDFIQLFGVFDGDRMVAGATFLTCNNIMQYHLAGSLNEYKKLGVNNLMLYTAANWARENQFSLLHLGGGVSDSDNDGLYKFKKSISPEFRYYKLGKNIYDPEKYEWACDAWVEKNNIEAPDNYFLSYRL